jgi:hypothetical protein
MLAPTVGHIGRGLRLTELTLGSQRPMALADREQHRFGCFGIDVAALGAFAQHI